MVLNRRFFYCIIFSILIGCIYIYPDIRFIAELGNNFNGVTLTGTADETYYLSRLNGVYSGNMKLANIGIYEHRDSPWVMPPYADIMIGFIGKALRIPVQYLDIVLSFIFPIIIFWLIYLLVYSLTESRKISLLGSTSIILGYALFTFTPEVLKEIISLKYSQPLWFLRPFSPQLIYIPFILSFLLMSKFIDCDSKYILLIIALSIASLNYLHIFLWAFLMVGLCVWLILSVITHKKKNSINLTIVIAMVIILGIPYWAHHNKIILNSAYLSLENFFGVEYTRRTIIPPSYILSSVLILILFKNSSLKIFNFVCSFLMGGLICLNQQIITGKLMEPVHFSSYTNKTFMIIASVSSLVVVKRIIGKTLKKYKANVVNAIFISIIVLFCGLAIIQQNNYFHKNKQIYGDLQSIKPVIDWMSRNINRDDVILTDSIKFSPPISTRLLLLYGNNNYYNGFDCDTLFEQEERENRIMYTMIFFKYPLEEAEAVFSFSNSVIFLGMSSYLSSVNAYEYIDKLKSIYRSFMYRNSKELLYNYRVNYVLVGKNDHLFNTMEKEYPDLVKVFDDNNYKIYQFVRI